MRLALLSHSCLSALTFAVADLIGSDTYSTDDFVFVERWPDECLERQMSPNVDFSLLLNPPVPPPSSPTGVNSIELIKYLSDSPCEGSSGSSVRDDYVHTLYQCLERVGLVSNDPSAAESMLCYNRAVLGANLACNKFDEVFVLGHDNEQAAVDFYQSPNYQSCLEEAGLECAVDYREVYVLTETSVGKTDNCLGMSYDPQASNFGQAHRSQAATIAAIGDTVRALPNIGFPTPPDNNLAACTSPAYLANCGLPGGVLNFNQIVSILSIDAHPRPNVGLGIVNMLKFHDNMEGTKTSISNEDCVGISHPTVNVPTITADMTGRTVYENYIRCVTLVDSNAGRLGSASWNTVRNGNILNSARIRLVPTTTVVGHLQFDQIMLNGYPDRETFSASRSDSEDYAQCNKYRECSLEYFAVYQVDGSVCTGNQCEAFSTAAETTLPTGAPTIAPTPAPTLAPSVSPVTTEPTMSPSDSQRGKMKKKKKSTKKDKKKKEKTKKEDDKSTKKKKKKTGGLRT